MYTVECIICKRIFSHSFSHTKVCGEKCRKERALRASKRRVEGYEKIPSLTVSAISELTVASDLMKKGYDVFRAVSPSTYCDLIANKGRKKLEVEVRTGYIAESGNMCFSKQLRKTANCFAVWERNNQDIYYFDKNLKKIKP